MQPRLMKRSAWARREFCNGSEPSSATVRKWIQNGVIEGAIIDGNIFVYEHQKAGVCKQASALLKGLVNG